MDDAVPEHSVVNARKAVDAEVFSVERVLRTDTMGKRAHTLACAHLPRGVAVFVGGTVHPRVEANPSLQCLLAVEL